MNDTVAAFFDAIERERSLPNVIRLRYLDANSESYPAIMKALAARGAPGAEAVGTRAAVRHARTSA